MDPTYRLATLTSSASTSLHPIAPSRRGFLAGCALALGATLLPSSGCGLLHFDIDQKIPEQRVQSNVIAGVFGSLIPAPFPLTIDLAQETKSRGTGPIGSAGLKALTFKITATAMPQGDSDNFDFVKNVEIYIESTKSGTTLQKQKIADLPSPPPAGSTELSLRCYIDVNLVPYINEGSRITSTASGSVPPDDVTFDGLITVQANL